MKAGLLGHGTVGKGVTAITDGRFPDLEITRILVKDLSEGNDPRLSENADEILNDPEIGMIAECMGGLHPAYDYVKAALLSGRHVVTSNKKMLAMNIHELSRIAADHNVCLRFEACAGGGIPWIHEILRTKEADRITAVRGILNGTVNYVITRMEQDGLEMSEALKKAQELGYAEADPSDDIGGFDTLYKIILSQAAAFGSACTPAEVPVFGIGNLQKRDIEYAGMHGRRIRLIGEAAEEGDCIHALVMPRMVKKDDPFAGVRENLNLTELTCRTLGSAVFGGQGAGSLPSGHAVVQDMLEIVQRGSVKNAVIGRKKWKCSGRSGVFYIRTSDPECWQKAARTAEDDIVITGRIAAEEMLAICAKSNDPDLFIAEIMDDNDE